MTSVGFWGSKPAADLPVDTVGETDTENMFYPGFIPQGYVRPMPMREESAVGSESVNNIDRGDYDHGVTDHDVQHKDQIDQTQDSNALDLEVPGGTPEKYVAPPVAVRVVGNDINERVEHLVDTIPLAIGNVPVRILPRDNHRKRVLMMQDAAIVAGGFVIYSGQGGATSSRYPIPATASGQPLEITSQEEVWVAGGTAASNIFLFIERYGRIDPADDGSYNEK